MHKHNMTKVFLFVNDMCVNGWSFHIVMVNPFNEILFRSTFSVLYILIT